MFAKVLILSCLVAVTFSLPDDGPPSGYGYEPPTPKEKGMPFEFAYEVKDEYSGNDYGHNSVSDGDVVTGEYRVLLPDGRTQIVTYTADHNGYQAEVTYEGEAKVYEPPQTGYGPPKPKPQPSYKAPAPKYERPQPSYKPPTTERPNPKKSYTPPKSSYNIPNDSFEAPSY